MKRYTEEIFQLTERIARQERVLDAVQRFEKEGGIHRMSLSIEHPDQETKRAIEDLSTAHFPADMFMKALQKWASDDLSAAKGKLHTAVIADALDSEITP